MVDTELNTLSRSLVVELAGSIGFRNSKLVQRMIWPVFRPVTDRLARIGLTFDQHIIQNGFSKAMGSALEDFISSVTAHGTENFPPKGPLLVVSNHPGTYDSLIISSMLQRDDLRIISSDIPFLKGLPHAYEHLFFISNDQNVRMLATRKALRHLKEGGTVLVYGYGHLDPDPAVYEDAPVYIDHWSPSIDLFLRSVPDVRILVSIVSHVVTSKWRNSILYRLRSDPLDRRRLVEFGQVIYQLLFPRRLRLAPRISFAPPAWLGELQRESGTAGVLPVVIRRAKALLKEHMERVNAPTNQ
jgi:Acyltransferase